MNETEKLNKFIEKAIFSAIANYLYSKGSIDVYTLNRIKKKIEATN